MCDCDERLGFTGNARLVLSNVVWFMWNFWSYWRAQRMYRQTVGDEREMSRTRKMTDLEEQWMFQKCGLRYLTKDQVHRALGSFSNMVTRDVIQRYRLAQALFPDTFTKKIQGEYFAMYIKICTGSVDAFMYLYEAFAQHIPVEWIIKALDKDDNKKDPGIIGWHVVCAIWADQDYITQKAIADEIARRGWVDRLAALYENRELPADTARLAANTIIMEEGYLHTHYAAATRIVIAAEDVAKAEALFRVMEEMRASLADVWYGAFAKQVQERLHELSYFIQKQRGTEAIPKEAPTNP